MTNVKEALDNWHQLEYHPLCTIFPEMSAEEYDGLVDSMKASGYHATDPILLTYGEDDELVIIDGRNRHVAAMDAGVTPSFDVLPDGVDLERFVVARNVERRMLTAGQRAAVASRLANLRPGVVPSDNVPGTTQADAARWTGASTTGIKKYRQIEEADPAIAECVASGKMSLEQGLNQVKKDAEPRKAAAKPPSIPPSLTDGFDEPAGSANMDFDTATQATKKRKIEYSATYDEELGKIQIRMGEENAVFSLRPDTAEALFNQLEMALDAASVARPDEVS